MAGTNTRVIVLAAIALMGPAAASAQLNVMISGGFSGAYEKLLPEFERASGVRVTTGSGASQGSGPKTIASQLAAGASVDVVILSREGLTDLIAANRIAKGTDMDLARVGMGVAVRHGAAKPDVSSVDAFKRTLVNAKLVSVPGSTSGIWFVKELLPKLGIADQVKVKATARGSEATGMVASGDADIGVLPVSEVLHAQGVDLAGVFPAEIDFLQTFSAAVVQGSKQAEAGKKLIDFLTSERAAAVIKQSGMQPPGKRK
jgi:molybdate transport system substrate-binding protein